VSQEKPAPGGCLGAGLGVGRTDYLSEPQLQELPQVQFSQVQFGLLQALDSLLILQYYYGSPRGHGDLAAAPARWLSPGRPDVMALTSCHPITS